MQNKIYENLEIDESKLDQPKFNILTARERVLFLKLMQGNNINQIAEYLNLSAKTVSVFISRIFLKLEVKNLAELVIFAMLQGIIKVKTSLQ